MCWYLYSRLYFWNFISCPCVAGLVDSLHRRTTACNLQPSAVFHCSSGLIHHRHSLHPQRWSWRRISTPCCCRFSALWSGSTLSSPSYPGTSSPELAPTWNGLAGSRRAQLVDTQQGLTEPSTAKRSWWDGCTPGWTLWTKCLNTLRGGFHRETVWAPGRCSVRRMSSSLMARSSRRWETDLFLSLLHTCCVISLFKCLVCRQEQG